jgi:hypothetical protein
VAFHLRLHEENYYSVIITRLECGGAKTFPRMGPFTRASKLAPPLDQLFARGSVQAPYPKERLAGELKISLTLLQLFSSATQPKPPTLRSTPPSDPTGNPSYTGAMARPVSRKRQLTDYIKCLAIDIAARSPSITPAQWLSRFGATPKGLEIREENPNVILARVRTHNRERPSSRRAGPRYSRRRVRQSHPVAH